jgi:uncharacterized protein (DUF362 family)
MTLTDRTPSMKQHKEYSMAEGVKAFIHPVKDLAKAKTLYRRAPRREARHG